MAGFDNGCVVAAVSTVLALLSNGRHIAALGPSEEPQAVSTWLRQYRRIADYSSISQTRSFFMGRPPEENDHIANMVPRLEYNLKARQLQRIKFGEVLSTGGARYPLMEHKRDADRLYEVHGKPLYELEALEAVATSPRGTAPIDAFAPAISARSISSTRASRNWPTPNSSRFINASSSTKEPLTPRWSLSITPANAPSAKVTTSPVATRRWTHARTLWPTHNALKLQPAFSGAFFAAATSFVVSAQTPESGSSLKTRHSTGAPRSFPAALGA